jgi:hypothetical protein
MTARHVLFATLTLVASVTASYSGEPARQPMGVAEFVKLGIVSHLGAAADVCTKHTPATKSDWERTLDGISVKVDRFTHELLGTAPFTGLDKESFPSAAVVELLKAVDTANSELKAQLEKEDPDANCPNMLKNIQGMSDDFLRAGVTQGLAGAQAMLLSIKSGYIK